MAEYSRIARGSFTTAASPITQIVNLPFQPQRVKLLNYTAYSSPAQYSVTSAQWDIAMGQGVAAFEYIEAASLDWILAADHTTSGISTFSAGLSLQYGARQQIVTSTKGATTSFQVTGHGYQTGDIVIFEGLYQSSSTGMPQMSGIPFVITRTDANNFTVNFNSNNAAYTNLSGSPTGAYVQKVLYPFLYAPGVSFVTAITTGTTTTVTTSAPNNFVVGQEIAFRIPSAWGTTQLNSLPDVAIPGSPIYGYVTSISSSTQFVCNINSTGYTAFTTNIPVANVPGLTPPQVLAVGDVNTGGVAYSGGALYPSPVVNGASTINGPAISGAFVNNTSQGFLVQNGVGAAQSSTSLLTASSLYIWEAFLYDYSV
jgi:hypothetical protein